MKNATLNIAVFCSFFLSLANAQKVLPPSSASNASTQPFLMFSARAPALSPVSPGHAFVSFGTVSTFALANISATYGFYPCIGCSMVNDVRPGRVVGGFWKNRNHKPLKWLAIAADTLCWEKTQGVIAKWSNVRYHLLRRNCVKFVSEVAKAQGLHTPRTTRWGFIPKFPKTYIRQLGEANRDRMINLRGIDPTGTPVQLDENKNGIPDVAEIVYSAFGAVNMPQRPHL